MNPGGWAVAEKLFHYQTQLLLPLGLSGFRNATQNAEFFERNGLNASPGTEGSL